MIFWPRAAPAELGWGLDWGLDQDLDQGWVRAWIGAWIRVWIRIWIGVRGTRGTQVLPSPRRARGGSGNFGVGTPNLDSALGSVLLSHGGQLSGEQLFADSKPQVPHFCRKCGLEALEPGGSRKWGRWILGKLRGQLCHQTLGQRLGSDDSAVVAAARALLPNPSRQPGDPPAQGDWSWSIRWGSQGGNPACPEQGMWAGGAEGPC